MSKETDDRVTEYVKVIIATPEWLNNTLKRYGDGSTVSNEKIATSVKNLDTELRYEFSEDES